MKTLTLNIILLLNVNFSLAQIINLKIVDLVDKRAALASLSGEKILFIDSISINNKSEFEFKLEKNQPGIYRLTFNSNNPSLQGRAETSWLDFIYDNEDIEIETEANNILDSLNVLKSDEDWDYRENIGLPLIAYIAGGGHVGGL